MHTHHTHTTVWQGPSAYTGREVRAVVKGHVNDKVGQALGLWILPVAIGPVEAIRARADADVCGTCRHSAQAGDATCYTHLGSSRILFSAPTGTGGTLWHAMTGTSRAATHLRSAVYGDVGALPADAVAIVRDLRARLALRPLGYTHAWSTRPDLAADHMASVDSVQEAVEARAKGWRYFRTREPGEPLLPGEVQCPATKEAVRANPITCSQCGLCAGNARAKLPSVSVWRHENAKRKAAAVAMTSLGIGGAR
jgi:hypothetical protein